MVLRMYSVRDSKGEIFNVPFFKKTHGEAERDFHMLANDEKGLVSKFPDDYDLYFIGSYDDQSGKVEALDTPQHILKAVQARKT